MPQQSELEKTQLEIAKLQLEQERHKLAQLQQRQKVVDGLGQGAVAVGGAAVKGVGASLRWIAVFFGWVMGMFLLGMVLLAGYAWWESQRSADFDWWYRMATNKYIWIAGIAGVLAGFGINGVRNTKEAELRFNAILTLACLTAVGIYWLSPVPPEVVKAGDKKAYDHELFLVEQRFPQLNPDGPAYDAAVAGRVIARLKISPGKPAKEVLRKAVEAELGPYRR